MKLLEYGRKCLFIQVLRLIWCGTSVYFTNVRTLI